MGIVTFAPRRPTAGGQPARACTQVLAGPVSLAWMGLRMIARPWDRLLLPQYGLGAEPVLLSREGRIAHRTAVVGGGLVQCLADLAELAGEAR